jgi:hypothetical protein
MTIYYDVAKQKVVYEAVVAQSTYIGMGYGTDMVNVDMAAWIADSGSSFQQTMYSYGFEYPAPSDINEYNTTWTFNATHTSFLSTRPLNPNTPNAYVIPLDESFPIVWAWQTTPYVDFHGNNAGSLSITLSSANGGCVLGAVQKYKTFTLHGVLLWFAWSILGVA